MSKIKITPQARNDLIQIAEYYGSISPQFEKQFLQHIRGDFYLISLFPKIGSSRTYSSLELNDIRVLTIPQFEKVMIFYRKWDDSIEVIRIVHQTINSKNSS